MSSGRGGAMIVATQYLCAFVKCSSKNSTEEIDIFCRRAVREKIIFATKAGRRRTLGCLIAGHSAANEQSVPIF